MALKLLTFPSRSASFKNLFVTSVGVQSLAHAKDNEALRWACKNNMTEVVLMLLEQPAVKKIIDSTNSNYYHSWQLGQQGLSDVDKSGPKGR